MIWLLLQNRAQSFKVVLRGRQGRVGPSCSYSSVVVILLTFLRSYFLVGSVSEC